MDRRDYYFLQLLSESELDDGFEQSEQAQRAIVTDLGLLGIVQGLSVVERSTTPDLTVEAASGQAYNPSGERMSVPSVQVVDVSIDFNSASTDVAGGGNEKIVSLFLQFVRALSDPRIDGNSSTVFFERNESFAFYVVQGAESAPVPTPPALEVDKILLADIRRSFGQTQIFNADITPPGGTYTAIANRRQGAFALSAGSISILEGTPEESDQAIVTELNNHVTGVSNAHPASALDYAGGPNWASGDTNPATTVELQLDKLVADLADASGSPGAERVGSGALTPWLGGRTRPANTVWDQLEAVAQDLADTAGSDDGAERIGGEARTSSGAFAAMALGSVASQLQHLLDNAVDITNAQSIAGVKTLSDPVVLTHNTDTTAALRCDNAPAASNKKTIAEFDLDGTIKARIIVEEFGGFSGGLTLTINANWNGSAYVGDDTGLPAARLYFTDSTWGYNKKILATGTWTSWDVENVIIAGDDFKGTEQANGRGAICAAHGFIGVGNDAIAVGCPYSHVFPASPSSISGISTGGFNVGATTELAGHRTAYGAVLEKDTTTSAGFATFSFLAS